MSHTVSACVCVCVLCCLMYRTDACSISETFVIYAADMFKQSVCGAASSFYSSAECTVYCSPLCVSEGRCAA